MKLCMQWMGKVKVLGWGMAEQNTCTYTDKYLKLSIIFSSSASFLLLFFTTFSLSILFSNCFKIFFGHTLFVSCIYLHLQVFPLFSDGIYRCVSLKETTIYFLYLRKAQQNNRLILSSNNRFTQNFNTIRIFRFYSWLPLFTISNPTLFFLLYFFYKL